MEPKKIAKRRHDRCDEYWQVDVPASIAGKRQKKLFRSKLEARQFSEDTLATYRKKGADGYGKSSLSLREAVAKFLPRLDERSRTHRQNASTVLNQLAADHGGLVIGDVRPLVLDEWLRRRKNENTRARDFRYLRLLFRWAYRMELIASDPVSRLDPPKSTPSRRILTPEEMQALLAAEMPPWVRSYILLAGFAGLRTEEFLRMSWESIDFESGEIHVAPGVQKDSGGWTERYVNFTFPLPYLLKKGVGKVAPLKRSMLFRARRKIAKDLGWVGGWPDNALRHSFASYHLALYGDASKTAHQMGHTSPAMVYRTYARAVKKAEAVKWWRIGVPDTELAKYPELAKQAA